MQGLEQDRSCGPLPLRLTAEAYVSSPIGITSRQLAQGVSKRSRCSQLSHEVRPVSLGHGIVTSRRPHNLESAFECDVSVKLRNPSQRPPAVLFRASFPTMHRYVQGSIPHERPPWLPDASQPVQIQGRTSQLVLFDRLHDPVECVLLRLQSSID